MSFNWSHSYPRVRQGRLVSAPLWSGLVVSSPGRVSGVALVCFRDGRALQQLPDAAEGHAERTNQHEGEIINESGVMRVQNERHGYVELEPIGKQAGDEDHGVPGAGVPQMQPQGVGQAEQAYELGLGVDQLPNDVAGLGAAVRDEPKGPCPPPAADEVPVGA